MSHLEINFYFYFKHRQLCLNNFNVNLNSNLCEKRDLLSNLIYKSLNKLILVFLFIKMSLLWTIV